MFNKLIKRLVIPLFFIMSCSTIVFATPVVEINSSYNNSYQIIIDEIDEDITALQLEIIDLNGNTNYEFIPSIDVYKFITESTINGETVIILLLDSNNDLSVEKLNISSQFIVGQIKNSFGKEALFDTTVKLTLINKQLKQSEYVVSINNTDNTDNTDSDTQSDGTIETLPEDKEEAGSSNSSGGSNISVGINSSSTSLGSSVNITVQDTVEEIVNTTVRDTVEDIVNTTVQTNVDHSNKYLDTQEHWAKDAIVYLSERGILNGVSDNSFEPERAIKRSEFVTILANIDGINIENFSTSSFDDVNPDDWFNPYVCWAVETGITSGVSSNNFAPDQFITREQMAVMIYRFLEYKNYQFNSNSSTVEFTDKNEISSYALHAISMIQSEGIINGRGNGEFAPKDNAKRSEAAQIIYNFLKV